MKLASLVNIKPLKEEYSSEYIEGDKVKFNPLLMKGRGFEDNLEHYDDLTGVVTKTSQGELEVKLSKSIIPPGGGKIDTISLWKSEGDYEMIEKVEPGAFWDVQSGGGLKEDLSRASMEELEALARQAQDIQDSEAGYAQQQGDFDIDKFGNEFADQKVMPYGGEYYSMNDIQDAIATRLDKSGDVPYDVAIGRMTQDEYDEYMSTVKPDRASFEKSSKFDRMNETTEKAWNAIDVSRKAEKEISNKEWNERTSKKLDILKALNSAGKFKKDFDEERLQGWVDQNYSWEKLARQFKLNESYSEMYNEMKVTDKDGKDVTSDVIKKMEKSLEKAGYRFTKGYTSDPDLRKDDPRYTKAEGSCGYSQEAPGGEELDTPGGIQSMDADDRTQGMLRKFIQREVKKLTIGKAPITKEGEDQSLDSKLKGLFSDKEWEKITNKPAPSFADLKPKSKEKK